jgi:hypothetical protein
MSQSTQSTCNTFETDATAEFDEFDEFLIDGLDDEPDLTSYSQPLTPEPAPTWHKWYPDTQLVPQHMYMDPEPPEVDDEDDVDELLREGREVIAAEKRARVSSYDWGDFWEVQDMRKTNRRRFM